MLQPKSFHWKWSGAGCPRTHIPLETQRLLFTPHPFVHADSFTPSTTPSPALGQFQCLWTCFSLVGLGGPSLAHSSSEHPRPRSWKNFSKFWLPLSMPTFSRLVGNVHLVLIVLRLSHHHGGQWSHKVVLERQVQGLGSEVLLLIAKSIFAAERGRAGGSARKSSLPTFPCSDSQHQAKSPRGSQEPPSPGRSPLMLRKKTSSTSSLGQMDRLCFFSEGASVSLPIKYKELQMATATHDEHSAYARPYTKGFTG